MTPLATIEEWRWTKKTQEKTAYFSGRELRLLNIWVAVNLTRISQVLGMRNEENVAKVWTALVVPNDKVLDNEDEERPPPCISIITADALSYIVSLQRFVHGKALDAFHVDSLMSLENAVVTSVAHTQSAITQCFQ